MNSTSVPTNFLASQGFLFVSGSNRVGTQDFALAKQALYHLSQHLQPGLSGFVRYSFSFYTVPSVLVTLLVVSLITRYYLWTLQLTDHLCSGSLTLLHLCDF
jgi:phage gp36-like protein